MNNLCPEVQALVFDLGGTHLRCAVWDSRRGISSLRRIQIDNFLNAECLDTVWNNLLSHIEEYTSSVAKLVPSNSPIVMSFPGPIENQRNILQAPTFLGSAGAIPDLVGDLKQRTGRRVYLLNDITAAAWYLSLTTSIRRFMVITISSGIGSKIFDASQPSGVIDTPAWAGEIGHLLVDESSQAPLCDCGERGHLGAIASGRSVERAARLHATADLLAFTQSACAVGFGATASTIRNEDHLVPAARSGDKWCLDVIRRATTPLARVVLAVVVAAGIERVIIIGGFALSLGPVYLQILREEIAESCRYPVLAPSIETLLELGTDCQEACLMGAGAFAQRVLEGC